jgi:hypothetical protein
MFSETVQKILEATGWTPQRRISITDWKKCLNSEGFTVHLKAVELLVNFGGIEVRPVKSSSDAYMAEVLRFDPILAASGEFDRVDYWQKYLKIELTPIAEVNAAILLLGSDGRVFSCWDRILWLDGLSFEDAIENTLLVPKRLPQKIAVMGK